MPPHILVVDDDSITLETFHTALRLEGFEVTTAASGECALETLGSKGAEAMLLDLNLDGMSGLDVLRRMREREVTTPTAVMTGFASAFSHGDARTLGAVMYLEKPLLLEDMLAAVAYLTGPEPVRARHAPSSATVSPSSSPVNRSEQLHDRVVCGDRVALDDVVTWMLPALCRRLQRRFSRAPMDFVVDAVEDAILEYAARPRRFDPARAVRLEDFLHLAARRNLVNGLAAEAARKVREAKYAALEARLADSDDEAGPVSSNNEFRSHVLAAAANPSECRALLHWLDGDRTTVGAAAALELTHLPSIDQQRAVKRFKDRIVKRVSRAMGIRRRRREKDLSDGPRRTPTIDSE